MSTFNVPVTITIVGPLPPPGVISVGGFSISADFSALPPGFLTVDRNGNFKASFSRRNGRILGPLRPGDKINFVWSIAAPLTVSGVTRPAPNVLAWTTTSNPNGTVAWTAVVTGGPVNPGNHHSEYDITLAQGNSQWVIDPDFETDVTDA